MEKLHFRVVISAILIMILFIFIVACSSENSNEGSVEVFFVENNTNGVAEGSILETPPFDDAGQEGWTLQAVSGAGVNSFIFIAEPEATWPMHSDPNRWYAYVLEGSGVLELGGIDEKITSEVNFNNGDFLIFEPDTMHGWNIDKDGAEILFILGVAE